MTREQMELLLNYLDAKLDVTVPPGYLNSSLRARYQKERANNARESRQQLLASLPPASERTEP